MSGFRGKADVLQRGGFRLFLATFSHCDDVGRNRSATGTVRSRAGALDARLTIAIAVLLGIRQLVPGCDEDDVTALLSANVSNSGGQLS